MAKLPGITHVYEDRDELFLELGRQLRTAMLRALDEGRLCHVALSGGGTPEPFYIKLVTDLMYRDLPWHNTHIWVVDERRVPETHEKSNWRMMREALTDHLVVADGQLHPVPTTLEDPAAAYQQEMADVFNLTPGTDVPEFDFILLGMGADAHTASLFPESPALEDHGNWIANNDGERVVPPARITFTWPLINASRRVAVLACGEGKAATLAKVAAGFEQSPVPSAELPITALAPTSGVNWFLDPAAAAQLG